MAPDDQAGPPPEEEGEFETSFSLLEIAEDAEAQAVALACRKAGLHLLNVLRWAGIQPDEIHTQAEALRQVWPTEWAYDAWCAWHACRIALRRLGWPEEEISVDRRREWRTSARFRPGPPPEAGEPVPAEAREILQAIAEVPPPGGGRGLVLVVDDDPSVQRVCALDLSLEGYEAVVASDGEEALRMARDRTPDLVLLDVRLPDRDGWEVLRELREDPGLRRVPVVMLTAAGEVEDLRRARRLGAAGYVTKPYERDELLGVVGRVLARRR